MILRAQVTAVLEFAPAPGIAVVTHVSGTNCYLCVRSGH